MKLIVFLAALLKLHFWHTFFNYGAKFAPNIMRKISPPQEIGANKVE